MGQCLPARLRATWRDFFESESRENPNCDDQRKPCQPDKQQVMPESPPAGELARRLMKGLAGMNAGIPAPGRRGEEAGSGDTYRLANARTSYGEMRSANPEGNRRAMLRQVQGDARGETDAAEETNVSHDSLFPPSQRLFVPPQLMKELPKVSFDLIETAFNRRKPRVHLTPQVSHVPAQIVNPGIVPQRRQDDGKGRYRNGQRFMHG